MNDSYKDLCQQQIKDYEVRRKVGKVISYGLIGVSLGIFLYIMFFNNFDIKTVTDAATKLGSTLATLGSGTYFTLANFSNKTKINTLHFLYSKGEPYDDREKDIIRNP